MNKNLQIVAMLLSVVLLSGCAAKKDSIYQVSTIVELMKGKYDGSITLKQLRKKGNFGVGTVNGLDGEFLFVNGKAYHLRGQVRASVAKKSIKTPYAMVTRFKPEIENEILTELDQEQVTNKLDTMIDTQNCLTAVKIDGSFKNIKFRIVAAQQPPYRPLVDVMEEQREVEMQNIEGTLVGFYVPRYMHGINTPGYHFHFLSKDKKIGGHVLGFTIQEGIIQLDQKNYFILDLNDINNPKREESKKAEKEVVVNNEENNQEIKKEEQRATVVQNIEEKREEIKQESKQAAIAPVEQTAESSEQPGVSQTKVEDVPKTIDENDQNQVSPAMTEN